MTNFTNTGQGARGINLKSGRTVYLEVGETLEFDSGEVKAVHPEIQSDEAALSDMKVDALKALAEAENIDLGDATKKSDIVSAIELAREVTE